MAELTDLSKIPWNVIIPDKALGLWTIPDLEISIPVYSWKTNPANTQAIVDAENSACWAPYCNGGLISDHADSVSNCGKGIWRMERVTLDMLAVYIRPDYKMAYRCYALYKADYHTWGYTINGSMVVPRSSKEMLCVSCVDHTGKQVYLAAFKESGRV